MTLKIFKMDFRIFLNLFLILSLISVYSQNDGSKFYGEEFSFDIENVGISLKPSLTRIKVKGEIISTCPMKGCWMNMLVANDTVLVRFKDYGFFVPKQGVEGVQQLLMDFFQLIR